MRGFASLLCFLLLVSGCTPAVPSAGIKISSLRQPPAGLEKISMSIKRSNYAKALEASRGSNNLRVVPLVISTAQAPTSPEYRLFNIKKGSIGDLLGLQNTDILIAAHEYVIQNPSQFYQYLTAVQSEKRSQIEIRRGDHPVVIVFDFIDG